jgi:phosphotransferase system enzyme I (PtsI)
VAVANGVEGLETGTTAMIDGSAGSIVIAPGLQEHYDFERRRSAAVAEERAAAAVIRRPALLSDGTRVAVLLNIADPAELDQLDPEMCDGIGLVRTELLFAGKALPDEKTQTAVYTRIATWAAGRPVTIRTLDAGGDKPIPGLTLEGESNPFLGVRGVRLALRHPDVFKTQLRALAQAAVAGNIEIMVPMVAVPREVEETRALLQEVCAELARTGVPYRVPALGIMVEVPAVAIAPERFAADFFSIGSNDLVQYTLAAGRDVPALTGLATTAEPAVLRLIANVAHHGRLHGRKVSICGDSGGDPDLIPLLLDAGLRSLSMAPSQVGRAKLAIEAYGRSGARA